MLNRSSARTVFHFNWAGILATALIGALTLMSSPSAIAQKQPGAYPTDAEGFRFLDGQWRVHNRKMKDPDKSHDEWIEFEATAKFFTLLDGLVSVEELRNDKGEPFGSAMRTFDREKRTWSDAWVSARTGVLQSPSHGKFVDGVGTWTAEEIVNGKKFLARGMWKRVSKNEVIWEAQDSTDNGKTWLVTWKMVFQRVDEKGKLVK